MAADAIPKFTLFVEESQKTILCNRWIRNFSITGEKELKTTINFEIPVKDPTKTVVIRPLAPEMLEVMFVSDIDAWYYVVRRFVGSLD